jgi:hypothetical protein
MTKKIVTNETKITNLKKSVQKANIENNKMFFNENLLYILQRKYIAETMKKRKKFSFRPLAAVRIENASIPQKKQIKELLLLSKKRIDVLYKK